MRTISLVVMGICLGLLFWYAAETEERYPAILAGIMLIALVGYICAVN